MTQKRLRYSMFFVPRSLSVKEFFRNPRSLRLDRGKVWNRKVLHTVKEVKVRALKQAGFIKSFASSGG